MKMKNKNAVTLTLLVVTIVVMFIIFGITFVSSKELLSKSQRSKMKTMLYMVKSRAEVLLEDYLFNIDDEALVNVNSTTIEQYLKGDYIESSKDLAIVGKTGVNLGDKSKLIYCRWDQDVLISQGIDTKNLAQGDDIYIEYNIEDRKVDVASRKGYGGKKGEGIHFLSQFE